MSQLKIGAFQPLFSVMATPSPTADRQPSILDVRPRLAAVLKNVLVVSTGVFQGVGKDRHSVESTVIINALCDPPNGVVVPSEPCRVDGDGTKGVAEDAPE